MSRSYELPRLYTIRHFSEKFADRWKKRCPHSELQGENAENLFLAASFPAFHAAPHELAFMAGRESDNAGTFFKLAHDFWLQMTNTNAKGRARIVFALWAMETTAKDGPLVWRENGDLLSNSAHSVGIDPAYFTAADFQALREVAERWGIPPFDDRAARNALAEMRSNTT